jgi:hypothetical protein
MGRREMQIGRPCGIYRNGPDSFLVTDDIQGTIYAIYPVSVTATNIGHSRTKMQ